MARIKRKAGVSGIEAAPTRIWDRPAEAQRGEANEYKERWAAREMEIVAQRRATLDYLPDISLLAGWLGAANLVFGSPKHSGRGHDSVEWR